MSSNPSSLAFVGAGALGQAFAGLLAKNGQAVTLLATPRTATSLLKEGRIRLRGVVDHDIPVAPAPAPPGVVGVTANAADLPAGVGLIFLTKGHDLAEAIATVRAAWPVAGDDAAWVAGLQNGLAKDDMLASAFGAERVVPGATILGGGRGADGVVTVTALGMTYLGEKPGGSSPRVDAAIEALMAAGIPAQAPASIQSILWSKACNAAGVFGVSVLARASGPQMSGDPHMMHAYLGLVRETAATGAAYGVAVGDYPNFPPIHTYTVTPDEETLAKIVKPGPLPRGGSLPSMTQDVLAGRPMEVEQVFGDLVERAERAGIDVPRLTLVCDIMRGIDRIARET
ncbi:MAG TPA: 2-dehydropantoate 2-reductase N-terminal domain-containing protein [Thermomicrobiales bacterium]